jgi:quinol monooxygenase YgiN
MVTILVIHRVENYDRWLAVFTKFSKQMKEHGCLGTEILRAEGDENNVVVLQRWADRDSFFRFRDSHNVNENREAGGVVGEPLGFILNSVATVSE